MAKSIAGSNNISYSYLDVNTCNVLLVVSEMRPKSIFNSFLVTLTDSYPHGPFVPKENVQLLFGQFD